MAAGYNMRRLALLTLKQVPAAVRHMEARVGQIGDEIGTTEAALAKSRGHLETWETKLSERKGQREAAETAHTEAKAKHDAGEIKDGAYVTIRDRWWRLRDRTAKTIPDAEAKVEHYADLVSKTNTHLDALIRQKKGLEDLLAGSDLLVNWKEARNAWYTFRDRLMDSEGADFLFDAELAADAAELHQVNEEIQRLKARSGHLADKLRRYVQHNPEGSYRTANDFYPARVFDGPKGRFLVHIQFAPRYFYTRSDLQKMLGPDFAPKWVTIDKKEFEAEVQRGEVLKPDGTPLTIEEVLPHKRREDLTAHVKVRALGKDEDPKVLFIPHTVGDQPIDCFLDEDEQERVSDLFLNEDEQGKDDDSEDEGKPAPTLMRHLMGVSRQALKSRLGETRAAGLLNRFFSGS